MNMVDFGYVVASVLIGMVVVVRGFPIIRHLRSTPANNWLKQGFAARLEANSWSENELSVGHANSAPARFV